jgi:hypothetical protein
MKGGKGFHNRRGKSVSRGALCEALVYAAADIAFPKNQGWLILHQFEPIFTDDSIKDIFDFGIFHIPENSEIPDKGLVLQVTQWPDKKEVQEEANKSYEVHETLEEFTYLGSRVRVSTPVCSNLPTNTSFGNIMFGNRRYVRKWIPTHLELFLDFVSYPSYEKNTAFPIEGLYDELEEFSYLLSQDERIVKDLRNKILNYSNSVIGKVGQILYKQFLDYRKENFPQSQFASYEFFVRNSYRKSKRFQNDIKFLKSQIKMNGMPKDRFKVKEAFASNGLTKIPKEWKSTMDAVIKISGEQIPEVKIGKNIIKDSKKILRLLNFCLNSDYKNLEGIWNHTNKDTRIAYRMILLQMYEKPVDDFYDKEVSEQNFSTKIFSKNKTSEILSKIIKNINELRNQKKSITKWIKELEKQMEELFNYVAINGTKNIPTTWALEYQIYLQGNLRDKVVRGGKWKSFTSGALNLSSKSRIITFSNSKIEDLPTVSLRSEFSSATNNSVYIKSKPTVREESRRAKEEGNKAWLGRMNSKIVLDEKITDPFSSNNFLIWVDGCWDNPKNLERLIECGWRVYLDPRDLVKELQDLV